MEHGKYVYIGRFWNESVLIRHYHDVAKGSRYRDESVNRSCLISLDVSELSHFGEMVELDTATLLTKSQIVDGVAIDDICYIIPPTMQANLHDGTKTHRAITLRINKVARIRNSSSHYYPNRTAASIIDGGVEIRLAGMKEWLLVYVPRGSLYEWRGELDSQMVVWKAKVYRTERTRQPEILEERPYVPFAIDDGSAVLLPEASESMKETYQFDIRLSGDELQLWHQVKERYPNSQARLVVDLSFCVSGDDTRCSEGESFRVPEGHHYFKEIRALRSFDVTRLDHVVREIDAMRREYLFDAVVLFVME